MSLDEIAALPVGSLADDDAHLYVWTTERYLRDTYGIVEMWGFRPGGVLVWSKPPKGFYGDSSLPFVCSTEFVLWGKRGRVRATTRHLGTVFSWSRPPGHSTKPDAFLDIVEQVSPGPYVELFARRARFGWDYWGDESLGTAEMVLR